MNQRSYPWGEPRDDDYPMAACPKCGKEAVDMDGFGFIACIPGCGYCTHPSSSGPLGGPLTCGICGKVTSNKPEAK